MRLFKRLLVALIRPNTAERLRVLRTRMLHLLWRTRWAVRQHVYPRSFSCGLDEKSSTYYVDPKQIRRYTANEFHYFRDNNRVVGGDWDQHTYPFEDLDFYQSYSLRLLKGTEWADTDYYKRNLSEIEGGKVKWGCRSKADWDKRCALLDSICSSIRDNGFSPAEIEDYVSINIARDGQMLFNNGRHRLTFAKLLGLKSIPVRVTVRHYEWVLFKSKIVEYAQKSKAGRIYAALTHPDLRSISSVFRDQRFEIIRRNISPHTGGTLLDIGANWGYFCHKLEDLGFDCTAVENDPQNLYFTRKLKQAEGRRFSIFDKSIFDLDVTQNKYDVVLALSIFHHFIKQEHTYHSLTRLLRALRVGEMYFEPHLPNEPQMKNAFRNYAPIEFVEFVLENSCLSQFEQIGTAEDGRPLYKLWHG